MDYTKNKTIPEPSILMLEYPHLEKNGIELRDFKNPYADKDEEVAGNLYKWIHQSYSVLWEVNAEKNEVTIFSKTIEKLGLRFATLLKMDKVHAIEGVRLMVIALAKSHLLWELTMFTELEKKGYGKDSLERLKNQFIFSQANQVLHSDFDNQRILNKFIEMFAKDVELAGYRVNI